MNLQANIERLHGWNGFMRGKSSCQHSDQQTFGIHLSDLAECLRKIWSEQSLTSLRARGSQFQANGACRFGNSVTGAGTCIKAQKENRLSSACGLQGKERFVDISKTGNDLVTVLHTQRPNETVDIYRALLCLSVDVIGRFGFNYDLKAVEIFGQEGATPAFLQVRHGSISIRWHDQGRSLLALIGTRMGLRHLLNLEYCARQL